MGTIISYFNLSKHYQNLIDFHHSIDGNWFLYLNFLIKSFAKKFKSKPRFDLYDVDIDCDPYAIGLLPPKQEWVYECPQTNKSENLLIYGTNSWGQYLIIEIKWRPQNNNKINANVRLLFKDENQVIYELNENDLLTIESNNKLRQYKIAGLTVQVVSPYRKLRMRFRGLLRRKDTNELVYSRFRLFWSALSNIFDFQNDFNDKYIAKELSALGVSEFKAEDRHEQWGQIIGSVQFGDENSKEVFLWGNKSKQYFDNQFKRKVTRIYGYDSKSFSFHVGTVRSNHNFRLQYGYVSAGNGSVYPMSGISSTFSELESIGINDSSVKKFKIEIKDQLREYDIEIGDQIDKYDDLVIYDMKLNGHNGKCLVIYEDFYENVNNFSKIESQDKLSEELVVPINVIKAKNVMLSGGKGGSLAALTQLANDLELKFSVPKGLIVTTNAYKQLIEESEVISNEIDKLEILAWSEKRENLKKYCQEFTELFVKQEMSKTLIENITNNLKTIFGDNFESIRFAVRSSALSEDSGEMSSAGQMTTILGVKGLPSIIEAVMKCWSSQFAFVAVEYKRGYGQEINSPMAVVIQEMINSETAGVIFTCDPITGDERNIFITANYGIGESVVSALAEPDTIKLSVNIESNSLMNKRMIQGIESIEIGSKQKSIVLNDNNESGTKGLTNSTQRNECCLSEDQCRELADIALDVHRSYGDPRDIEWAIKDNRIYLLQSRPITNLDNWTEWEAMHDLDSGQQSESEYFSRANLGEVFPGATSHLSLSYIINTWNANGFRNWRKMFRLPKKEYTAYYNRGGGIINNHYFFLLKTGGFPFVGDPKSTFSKSIQIGLFGHEFGEEFDDLIKDSNEKAPKKSFPFHFKIWLFFGSIKYFLTPGVTLRDAINKMSGLNIFRGKIDFTAKDIFYSLLKSYHLTAPIAYAHGKATMCSMMYNMFLLEILKKNNPNNENDCYSDFSQLVSSANQVVSAQVPNILRDIANSIKDRHKFRQMSDEKALKYLLYSESEASKKFKEFLLEYGHRGYKEFDFFVSQWGDNPIGIVKSLKTMLNGDQILRQTKRDKSIDEIISSLKSPLTKTSKILLKYLVIPWTQSGIKFREQGKHCLTWTQNVYRHAFWRLAKQMVSEGRLPDSELMFHMTLEELQILLEERDPTIIGRARIRRKVHPIKDSFKFPETTIGPKIRARNEISETISEPINGELARIKGTPVSAGKIKGRCCVAMSLEEAQNIQSGDILITYSTDIGWSPYFPMLSGLATEIGGLISHGAVIAREYGLPCLVGVEGAHRLFKTGDIIVIDSNSGEIYKIE